MTDMIDIYCYDPTEYDQLSKVRGVGRYLQILKENFPEWIFTPLRSSSYEGRAIQQFNNESIFINPFFNFLQPPLTLKRIAKKQIAVIHDLIPLKYPKHFPVGIKGKLNIYLNKLALKNYDLIVTDSEASKKDIINILYIDEKKIEVIYPCLPKIFTSPLVIPSAARNLATEKRINKIKNASLDSSVAEFIPIKSGLPQNDIWENFCLYVGDATWNKNLVNLAKAIKLINVNCVFVGKVFNLAMKQFNNEAIDNTLLNHSWGREFIQFLKEVENDKRFIFLGYVPDEQLIQLYRKANCNVLVSRGEGFGFSYLEAASQGCPSVLADIPVLHEVSNNQGALFAKPHDANDIANTVGEVYFNQDIKTKLGKLAQERAKYFSQKKFFVKFLSILNS